jgi:hypothetical protein
MGIGQSLCLPHEATTQRRRRGERTTLDQRRADRGRRHHAPHRPRAVVQSSTPGVGLEPTTSILTGSCAANCATPDRQLELRRNGSESALHLSVTIRAQQDALADLGTKTLNTASHPVLSDAELLHRGVKVMELQCRHAAIVAAEPASSTRLFDEDLLDPSTASHHRLLTAPATPEIAAGVSDVLAFAVLGAYKRCFGQASFASCARRIGGAPADTSTGPEPVLAQPMTHGCLAATERLRDLRDRHVGLDQRLEILSRDAPACSVLVSVRRLQPVFLDPVADRRFMPVETPSNLRQRQPLREKLLQRSAIHAPHCHANIRTSA